ncbi:LysM peptidoglycan-binding domain-containing protein [Jiella mangrovi]|uniref:LysM peptidoglycan-binding domain-containing protein n=1 Tax=Jiella mangrovi TaxID=2821407 RepID=A0ABS4BG26_9HYPH|nr:LysM peptidoglycan-binding domain-containing protein [Jiella mangrovi]MBP0615487.1 LysM peptidoglycan-binding domain-containing protein [Jiella mangrovi]
MMKRSFAVAGLLVLGSAAQSWAADSCGKETVVEPGDTISAIASRCDVSEGLILRANPRIDSSADLRVGQSVSLTGPMDKLSSMASSAGQQLSQAADNVGSRVKSSVEGFLNENPQLQSNIRDLGSRLGLSDGQQPAEVSLDPASPTPGTTVTVSATGLPKDSPVLIGGGNPGAAFTELDKARTTPDGTLQAAVKLPDDMNGERYQLSVRGEDGSWKAVAPPFDVRP